MKLTCTLLLLLTALAQISSFAAPGDKKWEFATDRWVDSSPAIGADGTVYVGSRGPGVSTRWTVSPAPGWEFRDRVGRPTILPSDRGRWHRVCRIDRREDLRPGRRHRRQKMGVRHE